MTVAKELVLFSQILQQTSSGAAGHPGELALFKSFITLLYHTLTHLLVTSLWLTIAPCATPAQATSPHNDT